MEKIVEPVIYQQAVSSDKLRLLTGTLLFR